MYKAILFDLDGTLLNTLDDLTCACNYALSLYGYPSRTKEEVNSFVGNGIFSLVEKAINGDHSIINDVYNSFLKYYNTHSMSKTSPYDGVCELLAELKRREIKLAVVTNKNHLVAKKIVAHYFKDVFDLVVGEKENIKKKPNPDMCELAIQSLNVSKEDCLYIGDSEVDVLTAYNAGIDGLFVSWGFRGYKLCDIYNNIIMIDKPYDIIKYIEK